VARIVRRREVLVDVEERGVGAVGQFVGPAAVQRRERGVQLLGRQLDLVHRRTGFGVDVGRFLFDRLDFVVLVRRALVAGDAKRDAEKRHDAADFVLQVIGAEEIADRGDELLFVLVEGDFFRGREIQRHDAPLRDEPRLRIETPPTEGSRGCSYCR